MLVPIEINLSATADIPVGNMAFLNLNDTDNPTIVNKLGGGKIEVLDWQTDIAPTVTRNFPRADISVKTGGKWYDYSSLVPDMTRDEDGLLLTALWLLNITETIEQILVSIY